MSIIKRKPFYVVHTYILSKIVRYSRFDPQYSQPDYWLQQAQQYAEETLRGTMGLTNDSVDRNVPDAPTASATAVDGAAAAAGELVDPKAEVNDDKGDVKKEEREGGAEAGGSDEDGPKVDLDTRLKMLMKGPQTSMPAFLLQELNNSESDGGGGEKGEEEAVKRVKEEEVQSVFPLLPDELPLSRPPSPFLTATHYLNCHKESVEERRRARQAAKAGRSGRRANGGRRPHSSAAASDKMSLSSLSSTENNILEQGAADMTAYPPPPYGYYPPPPGMAMPPGYPGDGHQPMYGDMYPGYGEYDPTMYYAQTGQYPPPGWGDMGEDSAMYTARGPGKEARRNLIE